MGLDMNVYTNSRELAKMVAEEYWADDEFAAECARKCGEIGYWRKFSNMHGWMVDNVQDGDDDCKDYRIAPSMFMKLFHIIENCVAILDDYEDEEDALERIYEIFPERDGFFFMSSSEWQIEHIRDTYRWFNVLLKYLECDVKAETLYFRNPDTGEVDKDWEVYLWYNSSW